MLRSALALSLLLTACTSSNESPAKDTPKDRPRSPAESEPEAVPNDPPPATPASSEVDALLGQVGDGVPVAFVLRPERWPQAHDTARSILTDLKLPGMEELLAARNPGALLKLALAPVGVDAAKLEGLDLQRPIVGGLGEPADLEPFAVPRKGASGGMYTSRGFRHVLFVPVSDAAAFLDALPKALPKFETLPSWDGAHWTGQASGEQFVAANTQGPYVRLVIFTNVRNLTPEEAKAQLAPRLKVAASTLPQTPALHEVVTGGSPLAVHVRPWRFRSFVSATGRNAIVGVLDAVDPSMRSMMLAQGLSVVLLAEMLMNDAGAEVDDWGLTLRVSNDEVSVGAVASLTPSGRALLEAAATELKPVAVDGTPVAQGFVRLDLGTALDKVELPESFTKARPREMAMRFAECGPGCAIHAGMRTPIRALKLALRSTELSESGEVPFEVLQGVLTGVEPMSGSVALRVPTADVAAARSWLDTAGAPPLEETKDTGGVTFAIHEGAKASLGAEVASAAVAEASLRVEGLKTEIGDVRLAFRLRHEGPAVVAEVGARRGADPSLGYAPKLEGMTWASPIESFAGAAGSDCLTEIAMGYSNVFGALATVAPDQRGTVLTAGLREVKETAVCLEGLAIPKSRLDGLSSFMEGLMTVPVGNVPRSSSTAPRRSGTTIAVEPGRLSYDGEDIDPEAEDHFNEPLRDRAEKGAEMAKAVAAARGEEFGGLVVIEVDPKVTFTRVLDVLWSVHQAGWPNFELAAASKDGEAVGIPIFVRASWSGGDDETGLPEVLMTDTGFVVTEPGAARKKTLADAEALQAWAQTYAAGGEARVRVRVHVDTPMQRVVDALDALRGPDCAMDPGGPKDCLLFQPILAGDPSSAG